MGLCLPRRIGAIFAARRPRFWPFASTTHHSRCMSFSFVTYVLIGMVSFPYPRAALPPSFPFAFGGDTIDRVPTELSVISHGFQRQPLWRGNPPGSRA